MGIVAIGHDQALVTFTTSVVFCAFADTVGEPQPGVGANLAK
jgi:hypothetical protein